MIDYQATKIFTQFVEQVTEARRTGDTDNSKAMLAEVFKLLGNSVYWKMIKAVKQQTCVIFTKDEKVVDRALQNQYFKDLEEVESRKLRIRINRPFETGISVYQLAKLRMLEFYYDFLDHYFDRRDFELIQMDTDKNNFTISAERLETSRSSQKFTHAHIAKHVLHKLAISNATGKPAQKGKQRSVDQMSGSSPGRRHTREHIAAKTCIHRQ